ncbi:MAG TPA: type IV toxin-antitoxin system AbiEi family antitoxin domain-containing protein [Actinomycetota bacterium]|nr:type IV toxin-antitoxin system AbiEi family antitoxin domain-containing protein [Actinomycetota bacterium]
MDVSDRIRVDALATRQYGLVTRSQCIAHGYSPDACDRRIRTGQWQRMHHGVYRLAGMPASWEQSLKAATLAVPGSLAYGVTAARLLGLPVSTDAVELGAQRHQRSPKGVTLHRIGEVAWSDQDHWLGIPCTSVTRTLIDISRVLPPEEAADALDYALARRLMPLPYVVQRYRALGAQGRRRAAVMGQLLAERAGQARFADSRPQRVLWKLIQARGWSGWVQEYRIDLRDGRVIYVDAACPEVGFGVEVNSYRHHSQMSQWASDHERTAAAIAEGWDLLPVTPYRLRTDPEAVGDLIELGLERRGYRGGAGGCTPGGAA